MTGLAPDGTIACRRLDRRHLYPPGLEARLICATIPPFVLDEVPPQDFGHHLSRDIVVGWSQPAATHQEIDSLERNPHRGRDLSSIVAHHPFVDDLIPEPLELFGDDERVRVDPDGCEKLAADGQIAAREITRAIPAR